jgi:hypothetical protein
MTVIKIQIVTLHNGMDAIKQIFILAIVSFRLC